MSTKTKTYAILFSLAVVVDWLLYVFLESNRIASWDSPIHSGWVVFSAIMLLLFAFLKKKWLGYVGLIFYFVIFALSFLDQFLEFSRELNYSCMLFNFALFTVYYFSIGNKKE